MNKDGKLETRYEYEDLDGNKLEDGVNVLKDIIKKWYGWADNVQK